MLNTESQYFEITKEPIVCAPFVLRLCFVCARMCILSRRFSFTDSKISKYQCGGDGKMVNAESQYFETPHEPIVCATFVPVCAIYVVFAFTVPELSNFYCRGAGIMHNTESQYFEIPKKPIVCASFVTDCATFLSVCAFIPTFLLPPTP